jgi:hypothetical protein
MYGQAPILPVMANIVFLTHEDDRNITKKLIFFNFGNYPFGIYIIHGFYTDWKDEMPA